MSIRASSITFRKSFKKDLQRLESRTKEDVEAAIQELLDGAISSGRHLKKLKGTHSRYAMRIGLAHRLTFDLDDNSVATLRNVGSRQNFYD